MAAILKNVNYDISKAVCLILMKIWHTDTYWASRPHEAILKSQSAKWTHIAKFCHKIDCHRNIPWGIGKRGLDSSHSCKYLLFGEKIVKIAPVVPQIIVLKFKKNKKN